MARITVDDIAIDYELLGEEGAPPVVLTPGGRFPRETPGLPELAAELVAGGKRVLLWDRPSCGASDISFAGTSESELHAETLIALVRALDLGPVTLAAGSAGSRVSLIAAARHPDMVSRLAIWWISGGTLGLVSLAFVYCNGSAMAAARGGMEAVAALPEWADQIARNPHNRDILLAQEPAAFIDLMQQWAAFYIPRAETPVPGMSPADFARLTMPVMVYRSGQSDLSHTRETSERVHAMIPHSTMREPPWSDQEWNNRMAAAGKGEGLFANWPKLAPDLLAFMQD